MCGIAGIYNPSGGHESSAMLNRMADSIAHRGPNDQGVWFDSLYGVGLAHRRLSILDLSAAGKQPMLSADESLVISFNGEIYNYLDLRGELEASGHTFRTRTDTEVLLVAVQHWGLKAALKKLVGMFAFAIWDRNVQKLYVARDRVGKKPVYYSVQGRFWAFASEMKALLAARVVTGDIDTDALSLFMRYGYVPSPATIFRNISKLPAGSILTLDLNGAAPVIESYWDVERVAAQGLNATSSIDAEEVIARLDSLLTDAVRLRLVADVEVGAFLSGGIDSSLVTAYMQDSVSRPVKTFTIGYREKDFNESEFAWDIASHLGTDHHELIIDAADLKNNMDSIASVMDEPFADISVLPTLLLSRMTASKVTVALSGDGGDELFCGYSHYARAARAESLLHRIPACVRRPVGHWLHGINHGAGKIARAGAVMLAQAPEEICRSVLSTWQIPSRVVRHGTDLDVMDVVPASMQGGSIQNYMMLRDMRRYLVDDILHKVDRASMAASLEVRAPLLDHRVVEFAWSVPLHLKVYNGVAKWPLKQLLSRRIPPALFERPKKGFAVPISHWLRTDLRGWADELFATGKGMRFLQENTVQAIWRQHLGMKHDRGSYLWQLLAFLAWYEFNVHD